MDQVGEPFSGKGKGSHALSIAITDDGSVEAILGEVGTDRCARGVRSIAIPSWWFSFWMELMFGGLSEQENKTRIRRWRSGMRGRVERGLHMSYASPPYGYKAGEKPGEPLVIDDAQARWVRHIYERRSQGWGSTHIADELNAFGVPSKRGGRWWPYVVSHIVHNPYYKGVVSLTESDRITTAKGQHVPLVTEDLWQAARVTDKVLSRDTSRSGIYLLSGLCRCAVCGGPCSYISMRTMYKGKQTGYVYIRCWSYKDGQTNQTQCKGVSVRADQLETQVREGAKTYLRERTEHFEAELQRALSGVDLETKRRGLIAELADIDARLKRWYDAMESGELPLQTVSQRSRELVERREKTERRLAALDTERQTTADLVRQRKLIAETYLGEIDNLTPRELRTILVAIVGTITLHPDHTANIRWA